LPAVRFASAAPRLVLVLFAAIAIGVGAHSLRADHRCGELRARALTAPRAQLAIVARQAAERCGDPRDRGTIAFTVAVRDEIAPAVALVRRMTTDNPDDYNGWFELWSLTRDRRALAHARELNPRSVRGR
jgi:hypothetical protein